jgi:hypothetical protein
MAFCTRLLFAFGLADARHPQGRRFGRRRGRGPPAARSGRERRSDAHDRRHSHDARRMKRQSRLRILSPFTEGSLFGWRLCRDRSVDCCVRETSRPRSDEMSPQADAAKKKGPFRGASEDWLPSFGDKTSLGDKSRWDKSLRDNKQVSGQQTSLSDNKQILGTTKEMAVGTVIAVCDYPVTIARIRKRAYFGLSTIGTLCGA